MIGKSHKIMGAALWFHAIPLLCDTPTMVSVAVIMTPLAVYSSLFPDIDHPKSSVGKKFPRLSRFIGSTFGHRGFTHSLLITLLLLAPLLCVSNLAMFYLLPILAINIGFISHILADWHTVRGVRLFWPLNTSFRLPIINCKTGSKVEVFYCMIWIIGGLQCISSAFLGADPYYLSLFTKLSEYPVFAGISEAINAIVDPFFRVLNQLVSN